MATTFAAFEAYRDTYAEGLDIPEPKYDVFIVDADLWAQAAFEAANVTVPTAGAALAQFERAQYAHVISQYAATPAYAEDTALDSFKIDDVQLKFSNNHVEVMDGNGWLARAYTHLYAAGLPKPVLTTAVMV